MQNSVFALVVRLQARVATDRGVSGKHANRPELDKCLAYLREGDVLVITRLSRAMHSLRHAVASAANC